jgi:hypothetical protein
LLFFLNLLHEAQDRCGCSDIKQTLESDSAQRNFHYLFQATDAPGTRLAYAQFVCDPANTDRLSTLLHGYLDARFATI